MRFNAYHQDITPVVWLGLPIAAYLLFYTILLTGFPPTLAHGFGSELGVLENAQVVLLLCFLALGGTMLGAKNPLPHARLRIWLMVLMGGALYTLVEEISWGQHYFGWTTPAWLAHLNGQNETNLHNIDTKFFFGIPRALVMGLPSNLLLTAIYVGGLGYPIATRGQRSSWFWPTPVCIPWAMLTACASFPLTIAVWLDHPLRVRHGEMQEFFMYGFLFTYLASLHYRLRQYWLLVS